MDDRNSEELKNISARLQDRPGRRLLRFTVAGVTAIFMVLLTILFMRYLITGYDRSASAALTRYISLPSFTISRKKTADIERITRPAILPETPVMDDEDLMAESSELAGENVLALPEMSLPGNNIDDTVSMPDLQSIPADEKSRMNELKEAILNASE